MFCLWRCTKIVGPMRLSSADCHRRLDPARLQRRHGCGTGVSGVRQHRGGQTDALLHRQDGFGRARRIGRCDDEAGGQDQGRPVGTNNRLSVVGLAIFGRQSGAQARRWGRSGWIGASAAGRHPAAWADVRAIPSSRHRRLFEPHRPGRSAAACTRASAANRAQAT